MAGSDQRGQLSSGLLAKGAGALKLASETAADAESASEAARNESGAELLYNKGDASASTFRPSYWSYERRAGEGTSGANITPIAAARAGRGGSDALQERAAMPVKPHWYSRTLNIAVLSFSTAALLASAAFFVLSLQHQGTVSPPAATTTPAPTNVVAPPTAVAEQPAAVAALPSSPPASTVASPSNAPSPAAVPPAKPSAPAPAVTGAGASPSSGSAASGPPSTPPAPPSVPTPTTPPAMAGAATPESPAATPAPSVATAAAEPGTGPAPTPAKIPPAIAVAPAVTAEPPAADTASAGSEDETHDIGPLIARGDELRATGDFSAARRFYELAAEQGSAAAARAVGETYDPEVLEEAHALGVRGDALTAASWYRKAIEGGDDTAAQRLLRLITKPAK